MHGIVIFSPFFSFHWGFKCKVGRSILLLDLSFFFRNSENKSYSFPNCDFLPNLKLDMYFKFINVGFISLRLVTMTSLKSLIHRFVIRIDLHLFFYTLVCCNTCIPGVKRPRSITNWTDAKLCTPICIYECVLPCMRTKRLCICKSALIFSTGAR